MPLHMKFAIGDIGKQDCKVIYLQILIEVFMKIKRDTYERNGEEKDSVDWAYYALECIFPDRMQSGKQ